MGSKLAGSLGALPIFGARTLRYERRALSRRKFTIFVPCVRTNPIIFLANDASGGAAAEKIACVEFIDENGGGRGTAISG